MKPLVKHEGMSRYGLYEHFNELGFKVGCEVGVWAGENARNMFQAIPDLERLYLVDPYREYSYAQRIWKVLDKMERRARNRLRDNKVVFIRDFSEKAIDEVPEQSLDFVYIDGNHAYDFVMLDIIVWTRKLRKGGILSGHDYFDSHRRVAGIKSAVNDYARWHDIEVHTTDGDAEPRGPNSVRSWFWTKEYDIYPY